MKRFIVAVFLIILGVGAITYKVYPDQNHASTPKVFVYNEEYGLIRFADSEEEIPSYMERQMDLVMECDSIKYYILN